MSASGAGQAGAISPVAIHDGPIHHDGPPQGRRHADLIAKAKRAILSRGYWSAFPETPSGKIYGDSARADGAAAYQALLGKPFALPGHPETTRLGGEISPWGPALGVSYPCAPVATLVEASRRAGAAWAALPYDRRIDLCAEMLVRLNAMSFLIAQATTHTTGQGFAMAFQAGGPHAQDRGLEALAAAALELERTPVAADWTKPQGRAEPIRLAKSWRVTPRGVGLVIGCNTFPTWNSYPALFADLAIGASAIVKPHPRAILPLALTVKIAREVLAEAGLPPDVVLLAVDAPGAEVTKELATHPQVGLIDYTGSNAFAGWLRDHARQARLFTEEAGVNSVVIAATSDFAGLCANLAFSLALYSGQMCTAPQNIYVPRGGIDTDQGRKSFDEVGRGIADAIDALLADPARARDVAGAIANPATLARLTALATEGRVMRSSAPLGEGLTASPTLIALEGGDALAHEEWFGPVAFLIAVADGREGVMKAAALAKAKGAITAALYATDEALIEEAVDAFAAAGANLSINLTGHIFVNQSAAFSDYHVTGANPAGNACLTDAAFIVNRYAVTMARRPKAS